MSEYNQWKKTYGAFVTVDNVSEQIAKGDRNARNAARGLVAKVAGELGITGLDVDKQSQVDSFSAVASQVYKERTTGRFLDNLGHIIDEKKDVLGKVALAIPYINKKDSNERAVGLHSRSTDLIGQIKNYEETGDISKLLKTVKSDVESDVEARLSEDVNPDNKYISDKTIKAVKSIAVSLIGGSKEAVVARAGEMVQSVAKEFGMIPEAQRNAYGARTIKAMTDNGKTDEAMAFMASLK